ncbi:MAG TPA: AMIN domain-containing protein [Clostridiaceae bacterium]|nr:AMIN domain-containing protein [Clostridiaceae bacterium]
MKKFISTVVLVVFFIMPVINSFAQKTPQTGAGEAKAGNLTGVSYTLKNGYAEVLIKLDKVSDYRMLRLPAPDRIVIDIYNTIAPYSQQTINVNSRFIQKIRYAQFENGMARVVLDVPEQYECKINKRGNNLLVYIGNINSIKDQVSEGEQDTIPSGPSSDGDRSELSDRGNEDRGGKLLDIKHAKKGGTDEVTVFVENYRKCNVMRLSNPDRIVVDFYGTTLDKYNGEQRINIDTKLIKSIRYAQFEKDIARVVIDTKVFSQYSIDEKQGKVIVIVGEPLDKNITYHNTSDRVYLRIAGAKLTNGDKDLQKLYTEKYDSSGEKYTITFPDNLANLNSGVININDGMIKSVEISKNASDATTSITFNAKDKFNYLVFTRADTNEAIITILRPAKGAEKLVVIDAGHGGFKTGAIYENLHEKDLTLDIALRLRDLLKGKGIRTYMIREDDSHVDNYERAYIANKLNASLFLSVHINAMDDKSIGGTMTLYCPNRVSNGKFTGKDFAAIIQSELLKTLNTTDRKVVERPNLVVLKYTAMPAAIAEVAFITNSSDREKLVKGEFRQKAAEALCKATIESLKKVG